YCPSIEDKIVRFGDRDGHQIFLEPEGLDDSTVYPNGISTSLPEEVQLEILASIPGLERARMVRPGYAIEYDHVDPRELDPDLRSKRLPGLRWRSAFAAPPGQNGGLECSEEPDESAHANAERGSQAWAGAQQRWAAPVGVRAFGLSGNRVAAGARHLVGIVGH